MIYTAAQYAKKIECESRGGPTIRLGGRQLRAGIEAQIIAVTREIVNGAPAVVVHYRDAKGQCFGVALDRNLADQLTAQLGPHPLVEAFFSLH